MIQTNSWAGTVLNHSGKHYNFQGRHASFLRNLDKSWLVQHPVVPDGLWLGCLYKCSSNCIDQMRAYTMTGPLSDNYTAQAQSVND